MCKNLWETDSCWQLPRTKQVLNSPGFLCLRFFQKRYLRLPRWGQSTILGTTAAEYAQICKLTGFADWGRSLFAYSLYQCLPTVSSESASLLPGKSVSVGRAALASYGLILWLQRRRSWACGLEGCHSALQPHAWSSVRIEACAACYKTYLQYRLDGMTMQWTCDAGKDAPFLTYRSISDGGEPLWGEIIGNLSNSLKTPEALPSVQERKRENTAVHCIGPFNVSQKQMGAVYGCLLFIKESAIRLVYLYSKTTGKLQDDTEKTQFETGAK